ncbi:MAG: outer membrane beta-barrel protein [Ferruginibacter sp.]
MENEFYTDEFEQLLKEKADQFSMYPSKRVWHSIYNNLHPSRRWPSVVISLFFISSLILIGYLNTGENSITRQINSNSNISTSFVSEKASPEKISRKPEVVTYSKTTQQPELQYNNAFADVITNETDFYAYTVVKSNMPVYLSATTASTDIKTIPETLETINNPGDIVQTVNTYIRSNQIFADIAVINKKNKTTIAKSSVNSNTENMIVSNNTDPVKSPAADEANTLLNPAGNQANTGLAKLNAPKENADASGNEEKRAVTNEEKAWMENYAFQNKPVAKKWKGRLGYQVYVTPAVNYRKLTTKVKGSATPFAQGDINHSISQKPGFGFEAGVGLNYAVAKRLLVKAGVQFNYTNYNIAADRATHPITTTILLNDPATGYSYSSARTSTTSNTFNAAPARPVTLHNRTYQVSLPVGFGYKLSSQDNVEWFAGATLQPSYYFGGKAHLISTDLKSYVSDPSSISSWNLNVGIETYMNFKLGTYNFQVGPQVRYQVNSTYKRDVALIEKPYAIGLKFGLTKGF